ncbi:bL21 family ribosomal protein, partial [Klebsiella pneumoniae]
LRHRVSTAHHRRVRHRRHIQESRSGVYAIVRSGGRQHKVAVGDLLTVDKIVDAEVGSTVNLTPLMLVDGDAITTVSDERSTVSATAPPGHLGPVVRLRGDALSSHPPLRAQADAPAHLAVDARVDGARLTGPALVPGPGAPPDPATAAPACLCGAAG